MCHPGRYAGASHSQTLQRSKAREALKRREHELAQRAALAPEQRSCRARVRVVFAVIRGFWRSGASGCGSVVQNVVALRERTQRVQAHCAHASQHAPCSPHTRPKAPGLPASAGWTPEALHRPNASYSSAVSGVSRDTSTAHSPGQLRATSWRAEGRRTENVAVRAAAPASTGLSRIRPTVASCTSLLPVDLWCPPAAAPARAPPPLRTPPSPTPSWCLAPCLLFCTCCVALWGARLTLQRCWHLVLLWLDTAVRCAAEC